MCRRYNGVWVQLGVVARGDNDMDGVAKDGEVTYAELASYHDVIVSVIGSF